MNTLETNKFIEYTPLKSKLAELKAGDVVKLVAGGERFWCSISSRAGDNFKGTVDSYTTNPFFPYQALIDFCAENIHDIYK